MATINVQPSDFIAKHNASVDGDTIVFANGVYNWFDAKSNRNYFVANKHQAIIRNASTAQNQHTMKLTNLTNVKVDGLLFDQNGIYLQACSNIAFSNIKIQNARRTAGNHQAVCWFNGLTNCSLTGVEWENCSHALMGYWASGLVIRDAKITKCGYGIKLQLSNGSKNNLIEKVIFKNMQSTMGLEIQGDDADIDGVVVRDVAYNDALLNVDDNNNKHAFSYSLPMAKAKNVLCERCFTDGNAILPDGSRRSSSASWKGLRLAHEVGGTRPTHRNNWIRNSNDPGGITTSTQAQCYDNLVQNCLEPFNFASPANGSAAIPGSRIENNNENVQLPAQGGWSLVGATPPNVTPPPVDPPPVDPPPVPNPGPVIETFYAPISIFGHVDWGTDVVSGWGDCELNMSNGNEAHGDGRPMSINGKPYKYGLGVHAPFKAIYDLTGEEGLLTFDAGIDDETNGGGDAVIEVYLDNLLVSSTSIVGREDAKHVEIDVTGKSKLKLIATTNGSPNFDHVNLANISIAAKPAVVPIPEKPIVNILLNYDPTKVDVNIG